LKGRKKPDKENTSLSAPFFLKVLLLPIPIRLDLVLYIYSSTFVIIHAYITLDAKDASVATVKGQRQIYTLDT
jgi:hypothetical protein